MECGQASVFPHMRSDSILSKRQAWRVSKACRGFGGIHRVLLEAEEAFNCATSSCGAIGSLVSSKHQG
jgi:hypothetical protein